MNLAKIELGVICVTLRDTNLLVCLDCATSVQKSARSVRVRLGLIHDSRSELAVRKEPPSPHQAFGKTRLDKLPAERSADAAGCQSVSRSVGRMDGQPVFVCESWMNSFEF